MTGVIKFYNIKKGFGFIQADETNSEYFFHFSSLKDRTVVENDRVSFDIMPDPQGRKPRAINVRKIL